VTETFGRGYSAIQNPMPDLPDTTFETARACVARNCPDDAELICEILGLL